jgi:hypothetical protein
MSINQLFTTKYMQRLPLKPQFYLIMRDGMHARSLFGNYFQCLVQLLLVLTTLLP